MFEYASVVWSPYAKDDISKLEMVQRKAARFVYNDFYSYSSVTAMLNKLNWESLAQRRSKAILTTLYIIKNFISINLQHHIHPMTSGTRNHRNRFISLPARLNCHFHSFLPTAIRLWNSLPFDLYSATDLNSFVNKLNTIRL